MRPIGIYLIADYIWGQVRRNRRPRMLLIDEAWALMQHEEGARFLSSMARRAREYYLGLTTVTQDVEDFLATPEGHTVLANSSVQILIALRVEASPMEHSLATTDPAELVDAKVPGGVVKRMTDSGSRLQNLP